MGSEEVVLEPVQVSQYVSSNVKLADRWSLILLAMKETRYLTDCQASHLIPPGAGL